jgi:hypothetical protein
MAAQGRVALAAPLLILRVESVARKQDLKRRPVDEWLRSKKVEA